MVAIRAATRPHLNPESSDMTVDAITAEPPEYDLFGPAFFADPDPTLHRMRREAPVYWHAGLEAWVLTRYDDVYAVVRGLGFSVDRGGTISKAQTATVKDELAWCTEFVFQWMVFSDPPRHTRLRTVITQAFSSRAVARLRTTVEQLADQLLAGVGDRGDLLEQLAVPLPSLVTSRLLGVPLEDAELLKRWTADMFALFGAGVASDEVVLRAYGSLQEACDYFRRLVARRRVDPGEDLLSALVQAEAANPRLSEVELLGMCVTLLAGAYETTSHLVGNGLFALFERPDQLELLRREPALVPNAVEEMMRFCGPALSVVRRAIDDTIVGGVPVRAGDRLYCMLHAANHDPARHADPDRLDVRRADPHHLGFGHGIHFCLGAALTRLEVGVLFERLLSRFPALALDRDGFGEAGPQWTPNLAIRGLRSLPVLYRPT